MKEYTDEEIEDMREELWRNECDMTSSRDFRAILWSGCTGFEHFSREEIIALHNQTRYIL